MSLRSRPSRWLIVSALFLGATSWLMLKVPPGDAHAANVGGVLYGINGARFTATYPNPPKRDRTPIPYTPFGVPKSAMTDVSEYTTGPYFTAPPPPRKPESDVLAERVATRYLPELNRWVAMDPSYTRHVFPNGTVRYESSIGRVGYGSKMWDGFEWLVRGHEFLSVIDTDTTSARVADFLNSVHLVDK